MCTLRGNGKYNKWIMLIILIIFDVNKSHVTILSDLFIVAVVKYLHNLIKCFELSIAVFQFGPQL